MSETMSSDPKTPLLGLPLTLDGFLKFRLADRRPQAQTREERKEVDEWMNE